MVGICEKAPHEHPPFDEVDDENTAAPFASGTIDFSADDGVYAPHPILACCYYQASDQVKISPSIAPASTREDAMINLEE